MENLMNPHEITRKSHDSSASNPISSRQTARARPLPRAAKGRMCPCRPAARMGLQPPKTRFWFRLLTWDQVPQVPGDAEGLLSSSQFWKNWGKWWGKVV